MGEKLESTDVTPGQLGYVLPTPSPQSYSNPMDDPQMQAEYQRMVSVPLPPGVASAQLGADGTWHGYSTQTGDAVSWNREAGAWERVSDNKPPGWWDSSNQFHDGRPPADPRRPLPPPASGGITTPIS